MLKREIVSRLEKIVGRENVLTSKEDLTTYATHAKGEWVHLPDAVVLPARVQQVSETLRLADEHRIPVTPRGGGTNLTGSSTPIAGGIVLALTKMNRIIEINKDSLYAIVEAGVILKDFNNAVAREGLYYPPDPQSYMGCNLGGTIAVNAAGPSCVKYGVTKHYVLGLEVVLASGEIVNLGGRTTKNVTGYDLTMLFTGSEGTLGVITKATLKLIPTPPAQKTIAVIFDDVAVAGENVSRILAGGVLPAKIELIDNFYIRSANEILGTRFPEGADALLLIQTDGVTEAVDKEAQQIADICNKYGAKEVRLPKDEKEAANLWRARAVGGVAARKRGLKSISEDVTVTRDKIPELIRHSKDISKKYGVDVHWQGHAGDGNTHPVVMYDPKDEELKERSRKAIDELVEYGLSLGGVVSGEHGVGLEKKRYFKKGVDPVAIELMKKIKAILDPNNILNPGKIWE